MGEFAVAAPEEPGRRSRDVDALVLTTIAAHAESLLRLARRHSLCADDAHDAYQRGVEIFLNHAHRLDPGRAPSWLRTVVKHEAMAVRRTRQRDLGAVEVDFDQLEARTLSSPEDQALGADVIARSAEALQRLKPQELQALWLQAQGNSYAEIEQQTGWSRTKVNRCVYEGRQRFLQRFAGIESGAECERWLPALSALVDGEATAEQLVEVRPHLRNCSSCRAVVRELHRAAPSLRIVLPVAPLLATTASAMPDHSANLFARVYESVTNWATHRAANAILRAQTLVDAAETGAHKAGVVLAASAAVAGGGAIAVQHEAHRPPATPHDIKRAHAAQTPVQPVPVAETPVATATTVGSQPAADAAKPPAATTTATTETQPTPTPPAPQPEVPAALEQPTTQPVAATRKPAPKASAGKPASSGTELGLE